MELYIILAISIAAGWFAWKIRGPKLQTDILWKRGCLMVNGRISPHQKQEIQEFFASQFSDVDYLRVTVLSHSGSRSTRPRFRIRGVSAEQELQSIRNFLASRLL